MSGFTSLGKKNSGGLGGSGITNANAVGPFGTSLVSSMTPSGQGTFVHGINSAIWTTGSNGGGSPTVSASDGIATCTSGGSPYASAVLHLNRSSKYRAGQGTIARLTAIFGSGSADTLRLAGMGNAECGFYFAMSGTNFGILHRERSKREIREFTGVTGVGVATLTVTLGGVAKSITINGESNANQTAYLISKQDYSKVGMGWTAEATGDKVYFISSAPGPVVGTFSIFNVASSIATAVRAQAGVLPTETFIPQSSWNIDPMDGTGPTRFDMDPTMGNVYGIGYQYLGFGNPTFSIENPETGLLAQCHMIQWAGSHTSTVIKNPTMTIRWEAINSGSSASSVSVSGASGGLFTEGIVQRNIGVAFSTVGTKFNVGATELPILTVRANQIYGSVCSYGELAPFNISLGNEAGSSSTGKLLRIQVYKNIGLTGPVNFQNLDSARSIASVDTAATGLSTTANQQLLKSIIVAANNSIVLKLEDENFFIVNGDTLTITAQRAGDTNIETAAASVSWFEDQ
jgi:hypothetical protein